MTIRTAAVAVAGPALSFGCPQGPAILAQLMERYPVVRLADRAV